MRALVERRRVIRENRLECAGSGGPGVVLTTDEDPELLDLLTQDREVTVIVITRDSGERLIAQPPATNQVPSYPVKNSRTSSGVRDKHGP